jgi:hypothetical protein
MKCECPLDVEESLPSCPDPRPRPRAAKARGRCAVSPSSCIQGAEGTPPTRHELRRCCTGQHRHPPIGTQVRVDRRSLEVLAGPQVIRPDDSATMNREEDVGRRGQGRLIDTSVRLLNTLRAQLPQAPCPGGMEGPPAPLEADGGLVRGLPEEFSVAVPGDGELLPCRHGGSIVEHFDSMTRHAVRRREWLEDAVRVAEWQAALRTNQGSSSTNSSAMTRWGRARPRR